MRTVFPCGQALRARAGKRLAVVSRTEGENEGHGGTAPLLRRRGTVHLFRGTRAQHRCIDAPPGIKGHRGHPLRKFSRQRLSQSLHGEFGGAVGGKQRFSVSAPPPELMLTITPLPLSTMAGTKARITLATPAYQAVVSYVIAIKWSALRLPSFAGGLTITLQAAVDRAIPVTQEFLPACRRMQTSGRFAPVQSQLSGKASETPPRSVPFPWP